jgi:dolichol-phosphate mannosyltransferase
MNEAIRPGPGQPSQAGSPLQLSVIVPTFNECDNVVTLVQRLDVALAGIAWEVIFVDDNSPDGTSDVVRMLARQDSRVRCIRRIGRRGLSGACIEGMLASSAPCAAVIDGDLQHDETQLAKMLGLLENGAADLVIGSRYVEGGSADSFNQQRLGASMFATAVAQRVLRVKIADPMSGFFMIRRDRFEQLAPQLSTQGFKILLDVVATAHGDLRVVEVPYTFGSRMHGESKLDSMVALDFLGLVLAKLTNDVVSLRFLLFALVGSIGLFVHFAVLFIVLEAFELPFAEAQACAALLAMTSNFLLNNFLTYRDQRLKGFGILRGLLLFYLVCSVGLLANVGVAFSVYDQEPI